MSSNGGKPKWILVWEAAVLNTISSNPLLTSSTFLSREDWGGMWLKMEYILRYYFTLIIDYFSLHHSLFVALILYWFLFVCCFVLTIAMDCISTQRKVLHCVTRSFVILHISLCKSTNIDYRLCYWLLLHWILRQLCFVVAIIMDCILTQITIIRGIIYLIISYFTHLSPYL